MKKKRIKTAIKTVSLLLAAALILSCFGCGGKVDVFASIKADAKPIYPEATDLTSHYCVTSNLKEIDASGLITLLFDENSSSIGVRITGSTDSKLWSSLPQTQSTENLSDEAEILGLEIIHNGKKYLLNSQDNSVAFGGSFTENTDDGFIVTYLITDNSDCIKNIDAGATDETYKAAAGNSILYKAVVTYTLKDGCLYASLDWKNLGNSADVLANIGFLEYFGATAAAQQGDFILVPDGSGAIINLAAAGDVDPVSIGVYGNDLGGESELKSVVAAYGLKNGADAFAAVIEQGDAVSTITANKALSGSNYNRVGASFAVTPGQTVDGTTSYSSTCYSGSISICFRFLSGNNATYAGLAAACREQLIRNYTLSTRSVVQTEYLPVMVNVIGAANGEGFFSGTKKLTTFPDARDILTRVKSKGINNVYLRYTGALSGGINAESADTAAALRSLGGKQGLSELNEYARGQNFQVFLDVDLLTGDTSNGSSAKTVLGKTAQISKQNLLTRNGFIAEAPTRYLRTTDTLEPTVLAVLERFGTLDSTGYCISDAGSLLYTDYLNSIDRQTVSSTIREKISPLATQSLVMVDSGNFYCLKNADIVSNLPMTCGREQSASYKAVPFVQIILHGIVDFSFDNLNLESNGKTAFLRCIEYGAVPGFSLTNGSYDGSEKYTKSFSIDNWLNFMYDCYSGANDTLNDLRGSRITNHYSISNGVYCTEYESTTKIYVNYTDAAVTVSGITVEPMSYFRVN